MYLTNKYTRWYYNIIQQAQTRTITGYTEKHHIIPRSLGGTNHSHNMATLTAREHFICHLLLTKMVEGKFKQKMTFALWLMCNTQNKNQQRYKVTSVIYCQIRKEFALAISKKTKGVKKNYKSFLGKTHSDKTKKRQSDLKLGDLNPHYGKHHTLESKIKIGLTHKGIAKPKYTCIYCGKTVGGLNNFLRWHKDRCSSK